MMPRACIAGGAPGEEATFIALGHLTFDSVEAFQNSFENITTTPTDLDDRQLSSGVSIGLCANT